jgi:hypothetical protein
MYSIDGRITYSSVKKVGLREEPLVISILPDRNRLALRWEGFEHSGVRVAIYSASGNLLAQFQLPTGTGGRAMIPFSPAPGMYIVEVRDRRNIATKKVWIPIP